MPRGRPRAFDRDKALRSAMHVFWSHGYEGASMQRLVKAMGIASPSIYAAFGGKEQLFREAVELYGRTEGGVGRRALREVADLRDAIATMLRQTIDVLTATDNARGCLITLGSSSLGAADDPVRAFLKGERDRTRRCLERRFAAEKRPSRPVGAPTAEPAALAASVMAFLSGLSIEVADGAKATALHHAAALFVDRLLPI